MKILTVDSFCKKHTKNSPQNKFLINLWGFPFFSFDCNEELLQYLQF